MPQKKTVGASKIIKPKQQHPLKGRVPFQRQEELELINKELAQSRAALGMALGKYTDLYDFAPVGYFTLTRNGVVHQVNLAGAKLLGMNHEEATRLRLAAFVSNDFQPTYKVFFEELLSGEGKKACELMIEKKAGAPLWVHLEASCFEGGSVCRAMMTDITDRKFMEQALQESENRFRMLLRDVSSVAVQGYQMDGTTQYWNTASEKLYGYSTQEAIGKNLLGLIIPPEMREGVRQAIKQMIKTGQPIPPAELSLMRKDGSRVAVYSSHAIVSVPGRATELFCLDIDLTERKQAEELSKESEWRNRVVSELTADYIFVVDVEPGGNLKLRWASDNMFRLTGRTVEEAATPDAWENIIHPEDKVGFHGFIRKILSAPEVGEFECRSFYKKGGERWVRIFVRPQVDEENNVTTIIGAVEDITERKRAEQALRESESLYRKMNENSPLGMHFYKLNKNNQLVFVGANPAADKLLGVDNSQFVGKTLEEVFPPLSQTEAPERYRDAAEKGIPWSTEQITYDHEQIKGAFNVIAFQTTPGNMVAVFADITERKRAEMEVEFMKESLKAANAELKTALLRQQQLAYTDALTGINNRRHLYELAEREFDIAVRYQQPLSLIMFDLDNFKKVNDTFGHAVGDQILQLVTQAACAELRSVDVIGRYGGEEFVVILPMTNARQAYPLAERIRKGVEAIRVPTIKGDAVVTLSIGIVEMLHGVQVESFEKLINAADEVMYIAKQAGRNQTKIG